MTKTIFTTKPNKSVLPKSLFGVEADVIGKHFHVYQLKTGVAVAIEYSKSCNVAQIKLMSNGTCQLYKSLRDMSTIEATVHDMLVTYRKRLRAEADWRIAMALELDKLL